MKFNQALITGATSGIGECLAHLLAKKEIPLILTGRNREKLEELKTQLSERVPVTIVEADLALKEGRDSLIQVIQEKTPDLVINNAGFGLYGSILRYSVAEQMKIFEVDGQAVLELTLEAAHALHNAGKNGVILNVSSAAGFFVFPSFAVYAATKDFVTHVSASLDYELAPKGIRVLAACPGMVKTEFRHRAGGRLDKDKIEWMSAEFAAQEIWKQIVSGKRTHLFNWKYRLAYWFSRLIPQGVLAHFQQKTIGVHKPH